MWATDSIGNLILNVETEDPKREYPDKKFLYVDISGVDNVEGVIKEWKELLGKDAPSRARQKIKREDVLVSTVRPNLNATAMVPESLDGQICSTGFCVLRSNGKVLPKYLYFFTRTPYFVKSLTKLTRGASYPAVTKRDITEIKIPLPSVVTQRKIVTILEKVHRLSQTRQEANQLTNKIIQSVFLKMFGNPATNPMGWTVKKLNEVCRKITDGTHVTPKYVDTGVPFLSVKDVRNGYLDFSDSRFISEEQHQELTKRSKPEYGDILYTKVGTVGIAALVDTQKEFSIFVSVALLKPESTVVDSKFIWAMLNSQYVKSQAHRRVKGIGVPDLHLVEIKDFDIILPPIEMQKRFAEALTQIESLRAHQQESTQEINELFHSLMHKAFRGELVA